MSEDMPMASYKKSLWTVTGVCPRHSLGIRPVEGTACSSQPFLCCVWVLNGMCWQLLRTERPRWHLTSLGCLAAAVLKMVLWQEGYSGSVRVESLRLEAKHL